MMPSKKRGGADELRFDTQRGGNSVEVVVHATTARASRDPRTYF